MDIIFKSAGVVNPCKIFPKNPAQHYGDDYAQMSQHKPLLDGDIHPCLETENLFGTDHYLPATLYYCLQHDAVFH